MNFDYTEEQTALQDTLRRFYARDYGFEHRRATAKSADGFDRAAWATFADFGILALPFPRTSADSTAPPSTPCWSWKCSAAAWRLNPTCRVSCSAAA
jgi:alkylation response protein AidB-like acyl-CoA dehydrogenase